MNGSSSPTTVSTRIERIAELARQMPSGVLTTLAHHIDVGWLKEAHRRTRKDGAVGVDRVTAEEYAKNLGANLQALLNRAKSGDHYRAPPVTRVHIPRSCAAMTPISASPQTDRPCRLSVTR
jgi:RNA-directed DNA polymerase